MQIERRGFLKVGTALVGGVVLAKYVEPILAALPERHEWIEDRGDFLIVRVPDYKTFAKERLEKPTIFLMGERATVRDVRVIGFSNVYAPHGGIVSGCRFDGSSMATDTDRAVMTLKGHNVFVEDNHFIGNGVCAPLGFV